MMNMKKLAGVIGASILLMSFTACAEDKVSDQERQDTLVYGSGEITSINPVLYEHGEINGLIFGGLMKYGKGNVPEAHLAETFTISEDDLVYDFYLRKGVLWHDGEDFTADDVKFTLEAIMEEENGSEIASNYEEIEMITAVDDHHVRIMLSSPNAAMLDYLTIGIVPEHILKGRNLSTDEFNHKPVGTGPYAVSDFSFGKSVTLTANEDYFRGEPEIGEIVFKFVSDSKTRALQLKAGELDLALVAPEDALLLGKDDGYEVVMMSTADYRGILYNFGSGFFGKHRELPNILSYGIHREAIVESVLLGHGEAAYSPLQRSAYVKRDMEKFSYDPERVVRELEMNGWVKGEDGIYVKGEDRLSFTINCMEGDEMRVNMALAASQQLKGLGVEMVVNIAASIDWENQEAFLVGWGSPYDPDDHTYKVFGTGKGSNYSGYSNPKVDEALTKARETADEDERKHYYDTFQEELTKDMSYSFIAYIDAPYVVSKKISGMDLETVLGHHGVGLFRNAEEWSLSTGE
ncbi:ABC transporter substrate-binding protein [Proteiniclasticum sp.]|uniref:ABC transporter substrate-binding protein n=1 Tax=Proteiniclasticum sp. TaxID=2053595 RepID=UPI0028969569|nr:ABC transporter substrate-binding protein [Proteiniclasticum sp.]